MSTWVGFLLFIQYRFNILKIRDFNLNRLRTRLLDLLNLYLLALCLFLTNWSELSLLLIYFCSLRSIRWGRHLREESFLNWWRPQVKTWPCLLHTLYNLGRLNCRRRSCNRSWSWRTWMEGWSCTSGKFFTGS